MPSNTPCVEDSQQTFRVIHPFHPLYGREFVLVIHRYNWGLDRVYFHNDDEQLNSLPTAWTDLFPPDPVVALSVGRAAFRLQDLLELSRLTKALQGKGNSE